MDKTRGLRPMHIVSLDKHRDTVNLDPNDLEPWPRMGQVVDWMGPKMHPRTLANKDEFGQQLATVKEFIKRKSQVAEAAGVGNEPGDWLACYRQWRQCSIHLCFCEHPLHPLPLRGRPKPLPPLPTPLQP